ncbi:MAG: prepilin-type N-terminal cleavage/methylation domain-containing protein [Planctomycetaceae bacterium]|jgi:type II secretion system protein J|nr:prepilin-type N-terminal cleavage/methylation domain-containing protein [Planctomycetaceae bacterium]
MRSSRSSESRHVRAFTIVEMVIAIAVGAIVVTTIATVTSRISRGRDAARVRLEAVTRAQAALDAVRRDLAAVMRDGDLFNTRVLLLNSLDYTQYGSMERDEVLVYNNRIRPTKRDQYAGEGSEWETQYRIEEDRSGSVLWMRRDSVPDENGEGGGMATPSVDGVVGLSIEAYDGEAWYPDWDSDEMGLPWAFRITVTATGDSPNAEASTPDRALATLRTQVAVDRIVPPPTEEEEEAAAEGEAGAGGEEAAQDGTVDPEGALNAGGGMEGTEGGMGGVGAGRPGRGGDGRRPGGGRGEGGGRGDGGGSGDGGVRPGGGGGMGGFEGSGNGGGRRPTWNGRGNGSSSTIGSGRGSIGINSGRGARN